MTTNATVSIALIFSIISALGVIVTIASTFKKDNESRTNEKLDIEKNFVKINVKLDSFCDQINQILRNQEKSNDELKALSKEYIRLQEQIETLFHYHSNHEKRINTLEKKGES